ncbi:lipoprotein LpqV [Mycobacterium haemophilum]
MRWCRRRSLLRGMVVLAAGVVGLSGVLGCSHSAGSDTVTSSSAGLSSVVPSPVGVSPAGVTTRVDVPADSTEEEYFQACHAAKLWMDAQPRTGESLVEPYLAIVQQSPSGSAGSWHTRWADLNLARQAAVITAAHAAANNECG